MGAAGRNATLHPKVYYLASPKLHLLVTGSAKLTAGGLSSNHAISTVVEGRAAADAQASLKIWISARLKEKDVVVADKDLIDAYEVRRNIWRAHIVLADQQAGAIISDPSRRVETLAALLMAMRAGRGEAGFDAQVARRRRSLPAAARTVRALSAAGPIRSAEFVQHYEMLIAAWHSGGMHRGKSRIAANAARFRAALRALAAARSDDPETPFNLLLGYMRGVPGAGVNVITEILHSRDRARFAVMNRNSLSGLRLAGYSSYPEASRKDNVDGALYARFCADALTTADELGLADLSELDALFNHAYWTKD